MLDFFGATTARLVDRLEPKHPRTKTPTTITPHAPKSHGTRQSRCARQNALDKTNTRLDEHKADAALALRLPLRVNRESGKGGSELPTNTNDGPNTSYHGF